MKVTVSGKYHGQAPYEMHGIDIELTDEDFSDVTVFAALPLRKRLDMAIEVAGVRCVGFALRKNMIGKDDAIGQIAGLKKRPVQTDLEVVEVSDG